MGLRFCTEHDESYEIGFKRAHRMVSVKDRHLDGVFESKSSKYPFTTATLYRLELGEMLSNGKKKITSSKVVAMATVGCADTDVFTLESGRVYALKALGKKLSKDIRKAMWECYMGRFTKVPPKAPNEIPPVTGVVEAIPDYIRTLEVLNGQTIH